MHFNCLSLYHQDKSFKMISVMLLKNPNKLVHFKLYIQYTAPNQFSFTSKQPPVSQYEQFQPKNSLTEN